MKRLRALGAVAVMEAVTRAESIEMLDAFVAQRRARDAALGLSSTDLPALRRFLDLTVGEDGAVRFYGLRCGDRIVATLGGTRDKDRFSGMVTSFAIDDEIARTSPGDLLLSEVMKRQCEAGLATFDLGIGEARYKETFCPEAEPPFDSLVPLTALGHVVAQAEAARLRLKRAVKQSPWAWTLVRRLRRAGVILSGPADGRRRERKPTLHPFRASTRTASRDEATLQKPASSIPTSLLPIGSGGWWYSR